MKRKRTWIASALLLFLMAMPLQSCGETLPTSKYEKVKYAFNGVEKSFKNNAGKKKSNSNAAPKTIKKANLNTSLLEGVKELYTSEDIEGNDLSDLSYDQPPMIQFQYLKAVLNKVGEGYAFNTKYTKDITGTIYIDMNTGEKKESSESQYQADYQFGLAIWINIDDQDLITADVSFDINVSQNNQSYHTLWYVNLQLDYDMNETNPTYTLAMTTENDERELPYYGQFTYEYDYVKVDKNVIKEWRKFDVSSDAKLVKDTSHPDFASYINEGNKYKVGSAHWYYDNSLHKIKQMTTSKASSIADILFKMGLNSTTINADSFVEQNGTSQEALKTIYDDFSSTYGDDIIYNLITGHEENNQQQDANGVSYIRAMLKSNPSQGYGDYNLNDVTFRSIFTDLKDPYTNEDITAVLYYFNQSGGVIEPVADINSLSYKFALVDNYGATVDSESVEVSLDDKISEAYVKYYSAYSPESLSSTFSLMFLDESLNVSGSVRLYYNGDLSNTKATTFPQFFLDYGVVEYEGDNVTFEVVSKEDYLLNIYNSNEIEALKYFKKLVVAGFSLASETSYDKVYHKEVDGQYFNISLEYGYSKDYFQLHAYFSEKQEVPPEESTLALVGSFNDWDVTSTLYAFTSLGGGQYTLKHTFNEGDLFKIVENKTWMSNYGYNDVFPNGGLETFFESQGSEDNIKTIQPCTCNITASNTSGMMTFTFVVL